MKFFLVLFCLVGAAALYPAAKDETDSQMEFYAKVIAIRDVPRGSALPGLHLDAKVNGRMTDIYVAPVDFLAKFEMSFEKGDDVHVVGNRERVAGADVVVAREIAVGAMNRRTLYLRDENGPLWKEETSHRRP